MTKHGLVSLVFWCLFVLYVLLAISAGIRLLAIAGCFGDALYVFQANATWITKLAKTTSALFHFTMATVMIVSCIFFYKGRKFAHRIVLLTPWTVVVFSILMWLAGNLYRVFQGEAFIPSDVNEFTIGALLVSYFLMFVVAFLNSWVATSESVVRWIEIEDASRKSMNRSD